MHEPLAVVRYLTHSAVTLAVLGAMASLGDRLLRRVGPQAQHRMWVTALLAGVMLPLLPVGAFIRLIGLIGRIGWFSHADAHAVYGTSTITYSMIAASAGRWRISPLPAELVAGAYLLTVLFGMSRLLWRWRRTRAMARRAAGLPLDAAARARVEEAARWFGVAAPEIRCSAETRGPVVLGFGRPLLLTPEGFFAGEASADRDAALAHECG